MTGRRAAVAAPQQGEAVGERAAYLLDRHGADPRRRELDGQRQAVEPGHDVGDDVVGQVRVGTYCERPAPEQLRTVGSGELAEQEDPLGRDAQRRPARGDDPEVARGGEQERDQGRRGVEHVLAVVEHEQGRDAVELLGDPATDVGPLRRREGTTAGHRVADAQRGPDLGDHVLPRRDADELDEVDPRLGRLAREHVGHPGLAQAARAEDGGQPAGPDERSQPGQVGLAPEQLVGVVAHPAAHRLVGGEELAMDPLERRVGVHAEPVGQVAPVGVVASERRCHPGGRGLATQQRLERLGVVRVGRLHLAERVHGLGVLAGPAQGQTPDPADHGRLALRDPAEPGERALADRVSGAVEQSCRRLREHERLRCSAIGQGTPGIGHQALEDPGVDRLGCQREPVAPVGTHDRLGSELGPQPRHQHLQRLPRDGGRVVAPHLVDQAQVGHPGGVQGERGQEVGRAGPGHRRAVVRHLVEEPQQDGHDASIGTGHGRTGAPSPRAGQDGLVAVPPTVRSTP